ncbi:MAG: Uma2 family endonuclease [Rhodoplanes sp.]|nr:Uma2 family endonuclease [Rhodoplanes sp.]
MTVDAFLAWAASQEEPQRAELINGQIVMMASERLVHTRIKASAYVALREALAKAAVIGEVFPDGPTVPIDSFTAYEPDALVRCGTPLPGDGMIVADPVIVVEVISPSSAHSDTSAKLIGYFKLPSVRHYLVIDPDTRTVMHHARSADGSIAARTLSAGRLLLDPPGLAVEVADLLA